MIASGARRFGRRHVEIRDDCFLACFSAITVLARDMSKAMTINVVTSSVPNE